MKPVVIWVLLTTAVVTQYVESFSVLHKILKINENATVEELKIAYDQLLKQW